MRGVDGAPHVDDREAAASGAARVRELQAELATAAQAHAEETDALRHECEQAVQAATAWVQQEQAPSTGAACFARVGSSHKLLSRAK